MKPKLARGTQVADMQRVALMYFTAVPEHFGKNRNRSPTTDAPMLGSGPSAVSQHPSAFFSGLSAGAAGVR